MIVKRPITLLALLCPTGMHTSPSRSLRAVLSSTMHTGHAYVDSRRHQTPSYSACKLGVRGLCCWRWLSSRGGQTVIATRRTISSTAAMGQNGGDYVLHDRRWSDLDGTSAKRGPPGTVDILFLGTGVSIGVPNIMHALTATCKVCTEAHRNDKSKDRRNNVSIAIMINGSEKEADGPRTTIMVDAGKTMRDSILRRFPAEGIREVHALLLTHGHADAILGLDDIRDLQLREPCMESGGFRLLSGPMDVYLHQHTMDCVNASFSYLTSKVPFVDKARLILQRSVAYLEFHVIDPSESFEACGVPVRALRVLHGGDYVCLGFCIGAPGEFVYISDVKVIPDGTMAYLKSLGRIKCLVLDCLHVSDHKHYAHVNLQEALAIVDELKPERVLFTGMCCDMGPHDEMNQKIADMGYPQVSMAYDGMVVRGIPIRD